MLLKLNYLEYAENQVTGLVAKLSGLKKEIQKVIVGQDLIIEEMLVALLAGGHCLLEGVPGLAKTLMVKTLSQEGYSLPLISCRQIL